MPILTILLVLIAAGVILWIINTFIPMDRNIKTILNIVVVIAIIVWLLKVFGLWDSLNNIRIWIHKASFIYDKKHDITQHALKTHF
jgi:hypothetical protein